jgi:uncharacterized protein YukE
MPNGTELLTLDPAKLRAEASVCDSVCTSLSEISQAIDKLCDEIRDVWYGAASQKFTEILETQGCESINKMSQFSNLMSQELNSVATNLETLDNDTATGYEG